MRNELSENLKKAMKEKQIDRVSTIRLISAAIKDRDIALKSGGNEEGASDSEILTILAKMIKQRQDSAEQYEKAGRIELAEKEKAEILIIEDFMPSKMSEEEVHNILIKEVEHLGANSVRDMGLVITSLKQKHAGRMDFSKVSLLLKQILS